MKVNKDLAALTLLAGVETAGFFNCFCPSYFDIKKGVVTSEDAHHVRSGYAPALGTGVFLAGIVSWLAESPWPLVASLGAAAIMTANYERALPEHLRLNAPAEVTYG